jgi:hypothetical protein
VKLQDRPNYELPAAGNRSSPSLKRDRPACDEREVRKAQSSDCEQIGRWGDLRPAQTPEIDLNTNSFMVTSPVAQMAGGDPGITLQSHLRQRVAQTGT